MARAAARRGLVDRRGRVALLRHVRAGDRRGRVVVVPVDRHRAKSSIGSRPDSVRSATSTAASCSTGPTAPGPTRTRRRRSGSCPSTTTSCSRTPDRGRFGLDAGRRDLGAGRSVHGTVLDDGRFAATWHYAAASDGEAATLFVAPLPQRDCPRTEVRRDRGRAVHGVLHGKASPPRRRVSCPALGRHERAAGAAGISAGCGARPTSSGTSPVEQEQQEVVGDLHGAGDEERPAEGRWASSTPASSGVAADGRLRGTLVTLDAAARSSAGTTAMTNDCRAGTSIWAKQRPDEQQRDRDPVPLGANAATDRARSPGGA